MIIYCDKILKLKKIASIRAGGGTNMKPVFEKISEVIRKENK